MTSAPGILAHNVTGRGRPVLLLNGGMMSWSAWEPVASRLEPTCRLVRCDFRGQLLSPGEAHRTVDGHVDDVVALLDDLGLQELHVLGTSFGAEVGLMLAARHPDRVLSLAAVTATDHGTPEILQGIEDLRLIVEQVLKGGDRRAFYDRLVQAAYSERYRREHREELAARGDQVGRLPEIWFTGLEGILACMEDLDLRPHLGKIACPTLVLIAGRDDIILPERSRALAEAIPGALVVEHPDSGHALVAEDPHWLAETCLEFLASLEEK